MKLGKLLGVGKSIFGGGRAVKYREAKGVQLPKFNVEKNPFTPPPAGAAPVPSAGRQAAAPAPKTPGPVRSAGWGSKLNPFRSQGTIAPPLVGAVQSELTLDTVRVVRNDLTDADIEVVPVKSQTLAGAEMPVLPPSRLSAGAYNNRLIGVG